MSTTGTEQSALEVLPLGQVRPAGWLREQLRLQRDGMAGHLDEFWPDVADSQWIGGSAEGWERGPYWLDGIVPLAFLLDDDDLKTKVQRWVDHILGQQTEDGWLGPGAGTDPSSGDQNAQELDVWPRMIVLKALLQYESATGDPRVVPAALRLCRRMDELLAVRPLSGWARARWPELLLSVLQLFRKTDQPWLLKFAQRVKSQGIPWPELANSFPHRGKVTASDLAGWAALNDDYLTSHGVNVAMALKAFPVWWSFTGEDDLRDGLAHLLNQLDRYHGQATGMFTADEHMAGLNPAQGSETCAVVELMFSLEVATEIWGVDEALVDRMERVAFNALPASARADEWGHQYDQQANQVVCHVTEDRIYTNNGPDANTFGLEPHFGCCTANRHQGWPKFAARLWMRSADGGLTAISYAPCEIDTVIGGANVHVDVVGGYPFDDTVTITVSTPEPVEFPLHLRIPSWASSATVALGEGETRPVEAGRVHSLARVWAGRNTVTLTLVPHATAVVERPHGVALTRGPLVFVLAIDEAWEQIGGTAPHASWAVRPRSKWNYALVTDGETHAIATELSRAAVVGAPFSPRTAPLRLAVPGREVEDWAVEHGAAAEPPRSPVTTVGPTRELTFLPYGAARLRLTELPWTKGQARTADQA